MVCNALYSAVTIEQFMTVLTIAMQHSQRQSRKEGR
jgi:hypothetical protein